MRCEIIAIGNELTSGRIINTTSGFAARHLFAAGYEIQAMHTIGDSPPLIGDALKQAISRVDFIIVTGGLGSTDDDLTTEAVAEALHRPTIPNLELLTQIRNHLDSISAAPVNPLEKLAWMPQGAKALNLQSKMSGYQLVHDNKPIFFLPGVPYQMQTLLLEQVLPALALWNHEHHHGHHVTVSQRIFKIFGMAEAEINRRVVELVNRNKIHKDIHVGYYPVFPEVHLSLIQRAKVHDSPGIDHVSPFATACRAIEKELGEVIYGRDKDNLALVTGHLLENAGLRLAVAESCTGGMIAQLITGIAGSSRYFLGGVIAYANSMKTRYLNVDETLLATHGAVSKEVAHAMATGVRDHSGADIAVAVTGIAGPDGGTREKPVGTVFVSLATSNNTQTHKYFFTGNRQQIQEITAKTALDLIRKYLLRLVAK